MRGKIGVVRKGSKISINVGCVWEYAVGEADILTKYDTLHFFLIIERQQPRQ